MSLKNEQIEHHPEELNDEKNSVLKSTMYLCSSIELPGGSKQNRAKTFVRKPKEGKILSQITYRTKSLVNSVPVKTVLT